MAMEERSGTDSRKQTGLSHKYKTVVEVVDGFSKGALTGEALQEVMQLHKEVAL